MGLSNAAAGGSSRGSREKVYEDTAWWQGVCVCNAHASACGRVPLCATRDSERRVLSPGRGLALCSERPAVRCNAQERRGAT